MSKPFAVWRVANKAIRERIAQFVINDCPDGTIVHFLEPTRSLEQNSKMWPMLEDIARQVKWSVDGQMRFISKEDWKVILTAGLTKNQRVATGIEGGFVLLGERTSKMSMKQMRELIEFMYWFGAEHNVVWSGEAE